MRATQFGDMGDRKNNFNAQTWLDIRMFADVCMFYQQEGLEIKTATILRDCVERVHAAICKRLPDGSMFVSTDEAVSFLKTVGISTQQMERDSRSRKRISDTLAIEDKVLDNGGSLDKARESMQARQLLRSKGISQAQIEQMAATFDESMSRATEEDRRLANNDIVADGSPAGIAARAAAAAERDKKQKEADLAFIASMTKKEV